MSTKYFCDGCDKDFAASKLTAINVSWKGPCGQSDSMFGQVDLCEKCKKHFAQIANPQNWPHQLKGRPND